MFNFLKKKNNNRDRLTLNLEGLHCTSCAVNIDLAIEDLDGVDSSSTNYAKSTTKIYFDQGKLKIDKIKKTVESLGYSVKSYAVE